MKGFGESFYVVLYSVTQEAWHIERLSDYIETNKKNMLLRKQPEFFMVGGLWASYELANKCLKELSSPELILKAE